MTDDRAAWHEFRRQGIGASDVPAILGLSRYGSPFSVWCSKVGAIPPDDSDDNYADFGRYAERMVVPWFQDRTQLHVAGEQMWVTHPDEPWMRATPDGLVFESPTDRDSPNIDAALGPLEIKSRQPGRRWDELPPDIASQMTWQALVTGHAHAWAAVLHGRNMEVYELALDPEDAAWIKAQCHRFWRDHVLTGEPPPFDGHDATLAALAALYPEGTAKLEHPLDGCTDALALLREAKRWVKAAGELEASAKAVLSWSMGVASIGTVDGRKALTLGTQRQKRTCEECGHVKEGDPFRVMRLAGEWA